MSVTINNSPVHSEIMISYPYGEIDAGYSCGWHTGVDFVPHGTTENNPILYPVENGTVVYISNDPNQALGCQVQILGSTSGKYWRYCHMVQNSIQVNVNDTVSLSTPLGRMGATGNVTGRHLHLELSTTQTWQCSSFENPCTALGIPNVDNTVIEYGGSPTPPTPTPAYKKNPFPWVLYARKLRNKRGN